MKRECIAPRTLKSGAGSGRAFARCIVALASLLAGAAAPQPMTLAEAFADPIEDPQAYAASACPVTVIALEDRRADPEMIGVFQRRAVKAPADRQAWLHGIVDALSRRGVQPAFVADPQGGEGIQVSIALERAWVTNALNDIAVSVVFRVDEANAEAAAPPLRFRGNQQKITYFSGGEGKIQRGVDSAFAAALDAMAAHFRARCAAAQGDPATAS